MMFELTVIHDDIDASIQRGVKDFNEHFRVNCNP